MAELDAIDESKWRKSSRSNGSSACVEVNRDAVVLVRDTKLNGKGPILAFDRDAWQAFLQWAPSAAPAS